MATIEELEQNARIALLKTYSSQSNSHAAVLVPTLLVELGLVQIKLRFFGILSILWWALFLGFGCGSIFLIGRLLYYGKLSDIVIHCNTSKEKENTTLNNVRNGVYLEFNRVCGERLYYRIIRFLFVRRYIYWLVGSLGIGIVFGIIGFIFNWYVIVTIITSFFK